MEKKDLQKQYDNFHKNVSSLSMATLDKKGMPCVSYAPFVRDKEGNFYIHISEMSVHTGNIIDNKKLSIMMIEDEKDAKHIFARKRLTFNCSTVEIERDSESWKKIIALFEEKFNGFSLMKKMLDFHIIKITPQEGRFVIGFGAAYLVKGGKLSHLGGNSGHRYAHK